MENGNFKTNRWLWLILSLALFIPLWFIPWFGKGRGDRGLDYALSIGRDGEAIEVTVFFFYGIPAVVAAWALLVLMVVVRAGKRGNDEAV